MSTPLWFWEVFFLIIVLLLALDLGVFHKRAHAISIRESFAMTLFYIVIALLFGVWIFFELGYKGFIDYLTAYFVEKSLSMDNIFVMSLIFSGLGIPLIYQHRVLFWGILGVIITRGILISLGISVIQQFSWILYIFGAFLLVTGIKIMFMAGAVQKNVLDTHLFRQIQHYIPLTRTLHGSDFFAKVEEKWVATPLFVALLMVEIADIVFAVDSVPAVLAITTNSFIVYTSNIFAILGLRSLYAALSVLVHRFIYLKYALALILIFIGGKIFIAELGFHIPSIISLSVTLMFLSGGILYSLYRTRHSVISIAGEKNAG
ncbi:MAG: TerC/Alx family metal homeostasis membrane protein [Alphaproteobacteria bacterium]|nr:TerC/Alx family metal homeostasis membrane protein [Alphaproteobacteria bacterium]